MENLIGNTPLLKLNNFSTKTTNIFAKLEGQNIGGSVKDRVGLALIEDLEKRGVLKPGSENNPVIIEPSSGNTGISLAMIGAKRGYKVKIVMPECATPERVAILKMFDAEIEFCDQKDWAGEKAIKEVKKRAKKDPGLVMPDQYANPACVEVHYQTTGKEILEKCPKITHLVATMGTGGTITGVAKKLKEKDPKIQVIGVEIGPDSKIPGPRSLKGYTPPILNFDYIDKRVIIKKEEESEVFKLQKEIAKKEGLFCGISSALALKVTNNLTKELKENNDGKEKNIVIIFPDRGEKYLSGLGCDC